jgi:hypothetical protein
MDKKGISDRKSIVSSLSYSGPFDIKEVYPLNAEFRCGGDEKYIHWLTAALFNEKVNIPNVLFVIRDASSILKLLIPPKPFLRQSRRSLLLRRVKGRPIIVLLLEREDLVMGQTESKYLRIFPRLFMTIKTVQKKRFGERMRLLMTILNQSAMLRLAKDLILVILASFLAKIILCEMANGKRNVFLRQTRQMNPMKT